MNLLKKSEVNRYSRDSVEHSIVEDICYQVGQEKRTSSNNGGRKWTAYVDILRNVRKNTAI